MIQVTKREFIADLNEFIVKLDSVVSFLKSTLSTVNQLTTALRPHGTPLLASTSYTFSKALNTVNIDIESLRVPCMIVFSIM